MSRYATLETQAPPPTFQGDERIFALDMKTPRAQLPAGYCSRAENKRFARGAETRRGTRTPLFANSFAAESFIGSGVFSDPNGFSMGLLCGVNHVIAIRCGCDAATIPIADSETPISGKVEFSQHFDKILLHRDDPSKVTLIWDGDDASEGFIPIQLVTDPDLISAGIITIPYVPWSINFRGRLWGPIPDKPDSFFASDINNYTVYDRNLHVFRVNTGTADALVGLFPYGNDNLLVAKRRSFDLLESIPGDLGDAWVNAPIADGASQSSAPPPTISMVSESIGMIGRKAGLVVGGDFYFLSDANPGGIYRIVGGGGAHASPLSVDPKPISEPIEPLMRRINWDFAQGAVCRQSGLLLKFAVPLDGCEFNNVALVFNTGTQQWQGMDTWLIPEDRQPGGRRRPPLENPMRIDNLVTLDYFNVARVFAVNEADGRVHMLEEGLDDQLAKAGVTHLEPKTFPISDVMETRGYDTLGWNAASYRDFRRLEMSLMTNNPSVTITEIVDGENDVRVLTEPPLEPSRVQYDIWGKPDYVLDNRNDDFDAPKRGDYAVLVGDNIQLQNGIPLQRCAPITKRIATMSRGRFICYRIENDRGYCSVISILEESSAARPERSL
jgi:hypothetical protein